MLKVLFFAQTRELIGVDELSIEAEFTTADKLREYLAQKGDKWGISFRKKKKLLVCDKIKP